MIYIHRRNSINTITSSAVSLCHRTRRSAGACRWLALSHFGRGSPPPAGQLNHLTSCFSVRTCWSCDIVFHTAFSLWTSPHSQLQSRSPETASSSCLPCLISPSHLGSYFNFTSYVSFSSTTTPPPYPHFIDSTHPLAHHESRVVRGFSTRLQSCSCSPQLMVLT